MAGSHPVLFSLDPHPLAETLAAKLTAITGEISRRSFPDGESYLQVLTNVEGQHCIVLAELSHPDDKFLPLMFLAATLKELGASSVGLLAPYLCYMRQDRRFAEGEAVTSRIFAALVSGHFDWLVTVDPHLHRYHALDELYTIPCRVVQGAPALANWLAAEQDIFLVGPDAESEQWLSSIADLSGHPYVIGEKHRYGDRKVKIALPDIGKLKTRTAVIIDDVIASGHTVLESMLALKEQGVTSIDCACVHGIFADGIDQVLKQQGLRRLVSCNSIVHPSNLLDVSELVLEPVREFSKS